MFLLLTLSRQIPAEHDNWQGTKLEKNKIDQILYFKTPNNVDKLRTFLGMIDSSKNLLVTLKKNLLAYLLKKRLTFS